jgi:hypothetical protein
MADVHVVPAGENWAVEVDWDAALDPWHSAGRDRCRTPDRRRRAERTGHPAEDGSIREKDSHGNDPSSIPG